MELAKSGAKVMAIFRSHADRAQKIVDSVKEANGQEPMLVQADLVTEEGQKLVFSEWKEKFNNDIDILVLCASGATMEINVDANMALVDKFLSLRSEFLKKGEKLSGAKIIFLQSEPGHFHRVIDGVFDFLEYYRTKVGPAKRAGEDALRKRLKKMNQVGVHAVVVCPPEVTDTFNMKLFELQEKQARGKSRELSAMLGTKSYVNIGEVASRVKELLDKDGLLNGRTELFGGVTDSLTILNSIYEENAVYVHTFQKLTEGQGVGRVIVNPSIWQREKEPLFEGVVKSEEKISLVSELEITKDHMRGHFRSDLAFILPGHKSIRTASVALGKLLNLEKIRLKKYTSVKFRSPVTPGQTLVTKVTVSQSGNTAKGDALQTVNGKESMDIRGMIVEPLGNKSESVLLLDQLIEAAAQTVGMQVLTGVKEEELLPLFHSTGEAEMISDVKAGDNLLVKAEKVRIIQTGKMQIFSADLEITRGTFNTVTENGDTIVKLVKEEKIAVIKSLQGLLLPKQEVLKKISS